MSGLAIVRMLKRHGQYVRGDVCGVSPRHAGLLEANGYAEHVSGAAAVPPQEVETQLVDPNVEVLNDSVEEKVKRDRHWREKRGR